MMTELRVASFQRRPYFDNLSKTVNQLSTDLKWCEDNDVSLAVFPECYLQGYASDKQTISRRALSLDGKTFRDVLALLVPFRTTIILGVIEKQGSDFYNTAVVVQNGNLLGSYSKSHPNEQGFKAGTDYPIFNTLDWTFGINICNDANFPEAALNISRQGARLICFPLNNMLLPDTAAKWRSKSIENLQQRAIETGCWVVSSDVVGKYNEKMSYGCTCIVRPDGQLIKQVPAGSEDSIIFDLC